MTIGEKIKLKRVAKNLTQDDLASACNVSRQTIYKWESDIALPDTSNLAVLCKTLDLTYEELLNNNEPVNNNTVNENLKPNNASYDYSNNNTFDSELGKTKKTIKKHWQKSGFFFLIPGLLLLVFGFVTRIMSKTISGVAKTMQVSSEETSPYANFFGTGYDNDIQTEGNAVKEAASNVSSMISSITNILSWVVIGVAAILITISIVAFIYDRIKMNKLKKGETEFN